MTTPLQREEKMEGLTFSQNVDGVALVEVQVLRALGGVVVEGHHLVLDGAVLQRVFSLGIASVRAQQEV